MKLNGSQQQLNMLLHYIVLHRGAPKLCSLSLFLSLCLTLSHTRRIDALIYSFSLCSKFLFLHYLPGSGAPNFNEAILPSLEDIPASLWGNKKKSVLILVWIICLFPFVINILKVEQCLNKRQWLQKENDDKSWQIEIENHWNGKPSKLKFNWPLFG